MKLRPFARSEGGRDGNKIFEPGSYMAVVLERK